MTKEEKIKRAAEKRAELVRDGLCVACRQPVGKTRIGKHYCNMCKATYRDYKAVWRDAHPEAHERHRKYAADRYHRLRAEHRCTACKKQLDESYTMIKCPECRAKYSRKRKNV